MLQAATTTNQAAPPPHSESQASFGKLPLDVYERIFDFIEHQFPTWFSNTVGGMSLSIIQCTQVNSVFWTLARSRIFKTVLLHSGNGHRFEGFVDLLFHPTYSIASFVRYFHFDMTAYPTLEMVVVLEFMSENAPNIWDLALMCDDPRGQLALAQLETPLFTQQPISALQLQGIPLYPAFLFPKGPHLDVVKVHKCSATAPALHAVDDTSSSKSDLIGSSLQLPLDKINGLSLLDNTQDLQAIFDSALKTTRSAPKLKILSLSVSSQNYQILRGFIQRAPLLERLELDLVDLRDGGPSIAQYQKLDTSKNPMLSTLTLQVYYSSPERELEFPSVFFRRMASPDVLSPLKRVEIRVFLFSHALVLGNLWFITMEQRRKWSELDYYLTDTPCASIEEVHIDIVVVHLTPPDQLQLFGDAETDRIQVSMFFDTCFGGRLRGALRGFRFRFVGISDLL